MKKKRDLILLGLQNGNESLIRTLRKQDVRIIGVDKNPEAVCAPLVDEFLNVSYTDDSLEERLATLGISTPVVLAGTTADPCYGTLFRLQKHFGNNAPSEEIFKKCIDKVAFSTLLKEKGFDTLPTRAFQGGSIEEHEYPVVIKSRTVKNKPIVILKNEGEKIRLEEKISNEKDSLVIQKYVVGEEYRVDIFPDGAHIIFEKLEGALYRNVLPGKENENAHLALTAVRKFEEENNLTGTIVKYDVIVEGKDVYILDVGFDHPIRFSTLMKAHGISYWKTYVISFVEGKPEWAEILKSISTSYLLQGGEIIPYVPKRPTYLSVTEGNILVSDRDLRGVWKYSPTGQFLGFTTKVDKGFAEATVSCFLDGNLYLNDQEKYRIQVFSPEEKYIGEFGRKGSKVGEFDMVSSLAAEDSTLLIADTGNDRIVRYDPRTKQCTTVVEYSFQPGILRRPTAVAVSPDNVVYVADRDNNVIQAFNSEGELLWHAPAERPSSIAFLGEKLFVVERKGREQGTVGIFSVHGKREGDFTAVLPEGTNIENPRAIFIEEKEIVWLSDPDRNALHVFHANGTHARTIDLTVLLPENIRVKDFFVADEVLYIPDLRSCVVYVITTDGTFVKTLDLKKSAPRLEALRSVAVHDDTLIASARNTGCVYIFDKEGRLLRTVGEKGSELHQFRSPVQVVRTHSGDFFVVDRENDRIVFFTKDWQPIKQYGC